MKQVIYYNTVKPVIKGHSDERTPPPPPRVIMDVFSGRCPIFPMLIKKSAMRGTLVM